MPISPLSTRGVFLLCLLITVALRVRTDALYPGGPHWDDPSDHHKYLYIAEQPLGSFHIQPTCWRIGVPLLTRLLPFSRYRNFDILAVFFLTLTGVVIYFWLIAIPLPPKLALLGVLMFYSLGGASKLLLQAVITPDPAGYFFTVLVLYAIYRENDWLCGVALTIGALTKEPVLLAGPLFYSLKAKSWWDAPRFKRAVLVCAPAFGALLAVRILIPAWNDRDAYVQSLSPLYSQVFLGTARYDLWTAFRGVMWSYGQYSVINLVRIFTYGSLGLQFFLPFFAPARNREPVLRWLPFWLPVLASTLIAQNPDRRVSSLFPMLLILGFNGISVLADVLDLSIHHFLVLFGMILALLLLKSDVLIVPFDLEAAVFLGWLAYIAVHHRSRKKRDAAATSL